MTTLSGFLLIGRMLLALIIAKKLCREGHSPRVFIDNHGAEVDIWGVGNLILESASPRTFDLSPELVELGIWIRSRI